MKAPNLEVTIFRDIGIARMYWEENFESIEKDLYIYTDNGQVTNGVELVTISRTKNTSLQIAAALDEIYGNGIYSYLEGVKDWTNSELVDELEEEAIFDDDYFDTLDNHNIHYTKDYEQVNITGYSQGDYAAIIVPTKALTSSWGNEPDLDNLQDYFTNLFYDAPLYFHLTINDDEYYHQEFWPHDYWYDKQEFIEAFFNEYKNLPDPEYIQEWLKENLPDYPEYI